MSDVVDLGKRRAALVASKIVERRKEERGSQWKAEGFTWDGRVMLCGDFEVGGEAWEVAAPMTIEEVDALIGSLQKARMHAKRWRDIHDGIVSLVWCGVAGTPISADFVAARAVGTLPTGLILEPCPDLGRSPYWHEPVQGWPQRNTYSVETGAPVDLVPRRRHWRIRPSDLRMLAMLREHRAQGA